MKSHESLRRGICLILYKNHLLANICKRPQAREHANQLRAALKAAPKLRATPRSSAASAARRDPFPPRVFFGLLRSAAADCKNRYEDLRGGARGRGALRLLGSRRLLFLWLPYLQSLATICKTICGQLQESAKGLQAERKSQMS